MSEPCARYFATQAQLVGFVAFVGELTQRTDQIRRIAAEALIATPPEDDDAHQGGGDSAVARFVRYTPVILETVLTRTVDNYLSYVSELLALAFLTRPEMLRSDESVSVKDVLRHDTMSDLIEEIAEQRVERLAYQSLRELRRYLHDQVGFDLFGSDEHFERTARLVEYRNLVVHNRGVVNRTFLRRMPESDYELGDRIRVEPDEVFGGVTVLDEAVCYAEISAADKWGIDQPVPFDDAPNYAPGAEGR